jgi:hypothetical protein
MEWGLASMLMSATLLLFFPLSLLVIGVGAAVAMNWSYWNVDNLHLADTVARLTGILTLALSVVALLFALLGLVRGLARHQPLGACVGGLVMSLIAVALMVALTIVIHVCSREFYKELPRRQGLPVLQPGLPQRGGP